MLDVFTDNWDQIFDAMLISLRMIVLASIGSLLLGSFLAAMRVSPVPTARAIGTVYVYAVRNTPLLVIMLLLVFGLPQLGWVPRFELGNDPFLQFNNFFIFTTGALALYTAAFVCEALRSGINTIPLGQAEAARSIGMTFTQSLRHVILPQAFRAVIPPLANTQIAMLKNSTVSAGVGVAEMAFMMTKLMNANADALWPLFFGFALFYVVLVGIVAGVASLLERKFRVA